jgi:hypothetical protein
MTSINVRAWPGVKALRNSRAPTFLPGPDQVADASISGSFSPSADATAETAAIEWTTAS